MKIFFNNQIFFIFKFLLALCALLFAVALAGCGGGNDGGTQAATGTEGAEGAEGAETTVTTSSRSKAEFVQLANGICSRDDTRRAFEIGAYLRSHQGEGGPTGADAAIAALRAVVAPKIPVRVEEIRALGAPEGDEKQIEEFLASLQGILDAPRSRFTAALRRSADLAHSYGIYRCAYLQ